MHELSLNPAFFSSFGRRSPSSTTLIEHDFPVGSCNLDSSFITCIKHLDNRHISVASPFPSLAGLSRRVSRISLISRPLSSLRYYIGYPFPTWIVGVVQGHRTVIHQRPRDSSRHLLPTLRVGLFRASGNPLHLTTDALLENDRFKN